MVPVVDGTLILALLSRDCNAGRNADLDERDRVGVALETPEISKEW
jgi:hypothetical protein